MAKKKLEAPKTLAEVNEQIQELRLKLHETTHAGVAGKNKNVHSAHIIKKDIARLMTLQTSLKKA
jgi:ribosomal protein L29